LEEGLPGLEGGFLDEPAVDSLPVVSDHLSAIVKYFPIPNSSLLLLPIAFNLGRSGFLKVGHLFSLALLLGARR
jgi:hypothetical protein